MTASKIEWTDRTWNPVTGCTRVSPGCDRCYAIGVAHRFRRGTSPLPLTERRDDRIDWTGRVELHDRRLDAPLHWRKPARVFVNSMSDLFHDEVSDEFIGSVFEVMAKTPQHTYQVLTKRHGRMRSLLNRWAEEGTRHDWAGPGTAVFRRADMCWAGPVPWPLPNVWLGVSVEDQQRADLRIPALLDTPAAVRWLSCEPLLGPVDLSRVASGQRDDMVFDVVRRRYGVPGQWKAQLGAGVDWVVAGGESGSGARPMHAAWPRQLRDQCTAAGVPFFFKQWGEWAPAPWTVRVCDPAVGWTGTEEALVEAKSAAEAIGATVMVNADDGHVYEPSYRCWSLERDGHDYPGAMRRAGKKAAGRELDGRTWDEFPAVTT